MAALVNSAKIDRPDDAERHRFLELLDDLRPSHLRLLAAVVTVSENDPGGSIDGWLRQRLPDQDLENIKLDWADLERAGVLQGLPSGLATTSIGQRVYHSLSAFGRRFVAFIEAGEGDDQPNA